MHSCRFIHAKQPLARSAGPPRLMHLVASGEGGAGGEGGGGGGGLHLQHGGGRYE